MRVGHILITCIEKIPSVVVMVETVFKHCGQAIESRYISSKDVRKEDIIWCDTLICVRGCESIDAAVVRAAKSVGRLLVYALDDDLLNIPKEIPCSTYFHNEVIQSNIKRIMNECEILWTVSPRIASKYKSYFSKTILLEACLPILSEVPHRTEPANMVRFLYAGSTDHSSLVQTILKDPIQRILQEYGDYVSFTFLGAVPDLFPDKRIRYLPYIADYDKYKETVLNGEFHIAFAIVKDEPFYACKYYNKFLEYTSIGAVGIYSALEPYTFIVQDRINGMLCANNPDQWYASMKWLLDHPDERCSILRRAAEQYEKLFSPVSVAGTLQSQAPEIITFRAEVVTKRQVHLSIATKFMFYFNHVKILIAENGWRGVWMLPSKIIKSIKKELKRN